MLPWIKLLVQLEKRIAKGWRGLVLSCLGLAVTGCGLNMSDQARVEPYEASGFFAHQQSARPLPAHVVPFGQRAAPAGFETGQTAAGPLEDVPISPSEATLERGQVQYDIFCAPCHGPTGEGDGLVVERGFPAPASFHSDRLRQAPAGYYFEVISQGVGRMYGYADRIPPETRWEIVAYIRTLQSE